MPTISMFYGISIKMFSSDHNPPHIHAVYSGAVGLLDIQTLTFIEGDLPKRARKLVIEWASLHQNALMEMWNSKQLSSLPPLK